MARDNLVGRKAARITSRDDLAVAQHGDAIGDPRQLFHPMRDVDDTDARRAQARESMSKSRSISRSVSAAVGSSMTMMRADARERFGDLDELLLADRELRNRHVERQL